MPASAGIGFLRGATYPVRGVLLLARERRLRRRALVPLLIYVGVFVTLGAIGLFLVDDVHAWLVPAATPAPGVIRAWSAFLGILWSALMGVTAFVLVLAGAVLGTVLLATALSGSFNEALSEGVEEIREGERTGGKFRLAVLAVDTTRAVASTVQLLGLFVVVYVPLLGLSFVPVVGVAAMIGLFFYSVFFLALGFLDPTLDRKRLSLRGKIGWARAHLRGHLGFGMASFGLMLIPFVNLFMPPALVVGGALLWLDAAREAEGAEPT